MELGRGNRLKMSCSVRAENPDKKFIAASKKAACCRNMKKITLEKMLWALEDTVPEVRVTEKIRVRAKRAVDKMLEIGRVS